MTAEEAAETIGELEAGEAADIIEEVTTEVAADIVEELITEVAADIIEETATAKAADIIEEIATGKAADIIEQVATAKAADIIEQVATAKAADIIEEIATAKAADIIEQVATAKAAGIIEQVAVEKAAAIMEKLTTEKLTEVVPATSEAALMERLPELSANKLYSIKPEVLFKSLPNAPTEQLVGEIPPEPPAELEAPVVVYTRPTGAKYLTIKTMAGEWVVVVGSPMPVDKLLIRTKRELENVGTTVDVFEELLPEIAVGLAGEQMVGTYFTITFENATLEDIALGHMTFKVEKDWLEQNSINKWAVTFSGYDPGYEQWVSLPTKRIGEDGPYVYYSVVISHFSTFAISGSQVVPSPAFKATNLAINPDTIEIGQEIIVSADITNLSDVAGARVVTLWIGGTIEAAKNIVLDASETTSVSFIVSGDVEGGHAIRVDRLFSSFTVTKPTAPPPPPPREPTPEPTPAPTPINWGLIGAIMATVIIIGVVTLLILRRRTA